jgi:ribosomal protein L21
MGTRIVEQNGKQYLIVDDRAMLIDHFDEQGQPVIKVETEETVHPDGRRDVTVTVPFLRVTAENEEA